MYISAQAVKSPWHNFAPRLANLDIYDQLGCVEKNGTAMASFSFCDMFLNIDCKDCVFNTQQDISSQGLSQFQILYIERFLKEPLYFKKLVGPNDVKNWFVYYVISKFC